jgi:hypothetical protein
LRKSAQTLFRIADLVIPRFTNRHRFFTTARLWWGLLGRHASAMTFDSGACSSSESPRGFLILTSAQSTRSTTLS